MDGNIDCPALLAEHEASLDALVYADETPEQRKEALHSLAWAAHTDDFDEAYHALLEAEARLAYAEETDFKHELELRPIIKALEQRIWEMNEQAGYEEERDMWRNRPVW